MSLVRGMIDWLEEVDAAESIHFAQETSSGFELKRDRWLEDGEVEADIEELRSKIAARIALEAFTPHEMLKTWLRASVAEQGERWTEQFPGDKPGPLPPIWPTGLVSLDAKCGGGSGYAVLAGEGGVGKTMQAMRSVIEACRAGWRCVYFNTEMTPIELTNLILRCCGGKIGKSVRERLRIINVLTGMSIEEVEVEAENSIEPGDEFLMLCLDSLDRLAKKDRSGGDFWTRLERWAEFSRQCALNSGSKISVLATREMGATTGADKGQSAAFDANLLVTIEKLKGSLSGDDVTIRVAKCRYSRDGDLHEHRRDWRNAQFVQGAQGEEEVPF